MSAAMWTAPAAMAAGLLVVAGAAKVARPHDTARALRVVGLPASPLVVRLGAAAEAGIGVWALAMGGALAHVAVAVSYLGFVAFLAVVMRRDLPVSSCGCLGEPDVPPTWAHVGLDLGAAVAAGGAALSDAPHVVDELARQPLAGLPFAALVAAGVALGAATVTVLPRLRALGLERAR